MAKIMDQREESKLKSSKNPSKERKMIKKMDQREESELKKLQKPSKERKWRKIMDQREESKLKSSKSPTVLDWENGEIIEKNKNLKKLKKVLAFLKTLIYNIICVEEHMINN